MKKDTSAQNNFKIRFTTEYTKKIEFLVQKNKYELAKLGNVAPKTEFQLLPKQTIIGDNEHEVALEVRLKIKLPDSEEEVLNLVLEYCGIFKVEGTASAEVIDEALLVDAVTLLFPFFRQEVARVTLSSGYAPIMLEPMDFRNLYIQYKTKAQGQVV